MALSLANIATKRYNLHTHTQFCDGRAPMEHFVRAAVDQGFDILGFTPHSPVPIPSPCNMSTDDVPRYLDEIDRLRAAYPSIRLLAGMEIDYMADDWGPACPYIASLPLDYSIGSVHFIPSQQGEMVDIDGHFDTFRLKMEKHFHNDIGYVVDTFFAQSIRMVEAGGFDIIGHLDKIGHNASHFSPGIEDTPRYRALASDLVDAVIAAGLVVEINTKALAQHGRFFPSPRLISRLVDARVPIVVNSDAHHPDLLDAGRAEAFKLLSLTGS